MTSNIQTDDKAPVLDLADCLDRVRQRDQAAARDLVEHVRPVVLRTVRRHLPRRDSAEDLTQEIFMKMFCRLHQYRGTAPFKHWLSKITLRTCFDHLRAQRARPELRHGDLSRKEVEMIATTLVDHNHRPPNDALANRELLRLLLARLNAEDRRVIMLFHFGQKSMAEISKLTGWTTEFVKMRAFRARRKLQCALAELPHWDRPAGIRLPPTKTKHPRQIRRETSVTNIALEAQAA